MFSTTNFDTDPVVIDAGACDSIIEKMVPENNGTVLAAEVVVEEPDRSFDWHWRWADH